MPRPKQFTDPKYVHVTMERVDFNEIQKRYGNFSDWVRQKIEEDLNAQNDISETEIKLAQVEQKRKEAEIIKQRAEAEARELELRLNSLKTPGPTLRKIQEDKLAQALKIIAAAETADRALDLSETWAKILNRVGMDLTSRDLLERVENDRNGMYG